MDGAGDQFLAGSAFAGDQHRGIEIGDAADELIDALHLRAGADEPVATGWAPRGAAARSGAAA